ncbi:AI-2E family transporter [Amycolatopsis balhimycina DSM 5908]|uniref:AI-2E family transporter n=1 Tax=Amycolatopsis balhimycina DSM 5908 TaxID=1081091 RepID=A0A428W1R0_AMYBA|nr:AI-2E family transporter [Amycolatopsis balhimycina]RSM37028.1 AI-2E family transporter [Amycolatopsis balhimycina DSM 5908]
MSHARREDPFLPEHEDVTGLIPRGLRISAALAWRFIVVVAALYAVVWAIGYLSVVVIPLGIALLVSALLAPAVQKLVAVKFPRGLATAVVLIAGLAVLAGLLTFVVTQFSSGLPQLQKQLNESLGQIRDWLINGPAHLRQEQIQDFINQVFGFLQNNQAWLTDTALTTAGTVGEIVTGFLLTLFITIFFLSGGDGIWTFLVRGVPARVRSRVDVAGRRGFASLVSYVRATAAVAVVDALGIGIGLWIMRVPLVIPLATLVFLGAFIPIIGAVITGGVAVLIALVTNGFIGALIVLAIVIGVMQLESHVLQPLLLGRAVKLHPLAVVLAITGGLVVGGIAGALMAVPILAVLNAGIRSLLHETAPDPAEVDVLEDQAAQPNDAEPGTPQAEVPTRGDDEK